MAHIAFSRWRWPWGLCVCVVAWPPAQAAKPPQARRGEPIESVVYLTQPPLCPGVAQPKRKARSNDVAQETKAHPPPPALKCAPFFFFFLRVKPSACLTLIPRRLLSSLLFSSLLLTKRQRLVSFALSLAAPPPHSAAVGCSLARSLLPTGWLAGRPTRSIERDRRVVGYYVL